MSGFSNNSKKRIKVKFDIDSTDTSDQIELEFDIYSDYWVKYSESSNAKFPFDKGDKKYPINTSPQLKDKPIKYIENGNEDKVKTKSKPKKAYSSILLSAEEPIIFDPNYFSNHEIELSFDLDTISGKGFIGIKSCQPDLYVYHKPVQTEEIKMFLMCETDDDQQLNYGEVSSALEICVAPGEDGSLDEYYSLKIGPGTRWVHKNDEVKEIDGIKYVVAGPKLNSSGNYECNTKPRTNNIDCPNLPSDTLLLEVKEFYKNNASYELIFLPIDTIYENYDSRDDNSEFAKGTESEDFINFKFGGSFPSEAHFYIVEDATGSDPDVRGYGINNLMVAETYTGNAMSLIIAHELGHALFNLKHPKDYPSISSDNDCFMLGRPSEDRGDKLSNKVMRIQQINLIRN